MSEVVEECGVLALQILSEYSLLRTQSWNLSVCDGEWKISVSGKSVCRKISGESPECIVSDIHALVNALESEVLGNMYAPLAAVRHVVLERVSA